MNSTKQQQTLTLFDRIAALQFSSTNDTTTFSDSTVSEEDGGLDFELQQQQANEDGDHHHQQYAHDCALSNQLVHYIPILARIYLNQQQRLVSTSDHNSEGMTIRSQLYRILQPYSFTSTVLEYEALDWSLIENATHNEMKIRDKVLAQSSSSSSSTSSSGASSSLVSFSQFCQSNSLSYGLGTQLITEFEESSLEKRARLLLSELACCSQYLRYVKKNKSHNNSNRDSSLDYLSSLDLTLLTNDLYKREVSYILCAAFNHTNQLFRLEELISVLCVSQCAIDHIALFVMNNPSVAESVVRFLVEEVNESNEELISDVLRTLSTFSQQIAYFVRRCCLDRGVLPRICLFTSLFIVKDVIRFLNSCLNSTSETQFMFSMIHKLSHNDEDLKSIRKEITETITSEIIPLALRCSVLRLCCGLCVYSNISGLDSEEHFSSLVKIGLRFSHSNRLVRLVISLLLLYCTLSMNASKSCLRELIDELWKRNHCRDTLLLIATYFHAQLYKNLSSFISTTANISNIETSNELYDTIRPIITEDLIPIDLLAKEILKIAPRSVVSGEDWYAIQCVYRMLQSRLFRKHSVDASQWVYQQIQCFTDQDPVPANLPDLIVELVSNCTPHPNFSFQMTLFTVDQVLKVVDNQSFNMTTKAIMLFYMLTVNSNNSIAESYGHDTLARARVVEIVNFLHKDRTRLGPLYSQLLSLIIDQLQHLFHLDLILTSNKAIPRSFDSAATWQSTDHLIQVLENPLRDQKKTKIMFDYLSTLNVEEFAPFEQAVIKVLPHLLQRDVRRFMLNSYENLWKAVCLRTPMQLALKTVNIVHPLNLTYDDIYKNILVVFGVNRRMFEVPALLGIFLQILNSYLVASRKSILSSKNIPKNTDNSIQNSYVVTQEATVLQLLLEICIIDADIDTGDRITIQKLICSFVHQRFIENPVLAKLLHFQTYDPKLLPIIVNGVDSIHICMDFLLELLSQPQLEKQVFGVQLAAYLCEKYPLPRCTEIACAAINRIRQVGQLTGSFTNKTVEASAAIGTKSSSDANKNIPGAQGTVLTKATKQEYLDAINQLVDVLVRFTVAFPFLSIECIQALDELKTNFRRDEEITRRVRATFKTLCTSVLSNVNK